MSLINNINGLTGGEWMNVLAKARRGQIERREIKELVKMNNFFVFLNGACGRMLNDPRDTYYYLLILRPFLEYLTDTHYKPNWEYELLNEALNKFKSNKEQV